MRFSLPCIRFLERERERERDREIENDACYTHV